MTIATSAPAIPRIGDPAPDFVAQTTHGELRFSTWREGRWTVLFSHPADFTPVCSTELAELARRADEFDRRDARLIGISVDSVHSHLAWIQNLRATQGVRLAYPLVADADRAVSEAYGLLHPGESSTATVRALFLIDPAGIVRAIIYYPLNVGRSVDEILRVTDALQAADGHGVATPVDWHPGDPVVVPPPRTLAEVEQRIGDDAERLDFYLEKRPLS